MPFLVVWLGLTGSETVCTAPTLCLDVMATILTSQGESVVGLDGEDISAAMRGDEGAQHGPIYYYDEQHLDAVRSRRWKLHRRRHTWGGRDRNAQLSLPQLFDLEVDPAESYDVSERHPEVVRELLALLEQEEARL